jgi:hypothetical protein
LKALLKNNFFTIALLLFVFSPAAGYCQNQIFDPLTINSYQVATYKPATASKGADGDTLIKLFGGLIKFNKGAKGKKGKKSPDLNVRVSAISSGDSTIIKVTIQVNGEKREPDIYYVNPRHGKIMISADGGDGGQGGKGAPDGGADGKGGLGGNGGRVEVIFEPAAIAFANCQCLLFSNQGGVGGGTGTNYKYGAESGSPGPPVTYKNADGKTIIVKQ